MTNFGHILRSYMNDQRHSLATLSNEIGINKSVLHRAMDGKIPNGKAVIKIINWIFKGVN